MWVALRTIENTNVRQPNPRDMRSNSYRTGGRNASQRDTSKTTSMPRRTFLATGAAISTATVAGCLTGGSTSTPGGEPDAPWTTEALADYIDGDGEITIYAATGDSQQWYDLIEVINDEFDTNISGNVVAGNGSEMSQRFIQERQAGEDKVDVMSSMSDLRARIQETRRKESKDAALEVAKGWFEWDLDKNFWFKDAMSEKLMLPFMVSTRNGGAGLVLPISKQVWDEEGLDRPTTYNDLLDSQYEGVKVGMPSYKNPEMLGWIIRHHADQTDMDRMEWTKTFMDQFEIVGFDSYANTMRALGKGEIGIMVYNWPWAAAPFIKDSELQADGVFTQPVKRNAMEGDMYINKKAPNPWLARFFLSAVLETSVQGRMINDVVDQVPVRTDALDLSEYDLHPYTERRLGADVTQIGFWETSKYVQTGQKAMETGVFKP